MPLPQRDKPRLKRTAAQKAWKGLTDEELEGLETKITEKFQWTHAPRSFQMTAIRAQLLQKDVLIHAGTGSGKTAVAAGPHAHEKVKGMVTFMVTPLIALQEEQVLLKIFCRNNDMCLPWLL